jgi:hypothetical protein
MNGFESNTIAAGAQCFTYCATAPIISGDAGCLYQEKKTVGVK